MDLTKQATPRFDPGSPEYRWKLWVTILEPGGNPRVVLLWRHIATAFLLLAVAGWLATAGAAWTFIRFRHGFTASYLNLVWPPLWPQHREALGRHYLVRGQRALAAGEFSDAAAFLAAGVARVPADIAARRQLAIVYLRFGLRQGALDVLGVGLPQARDDLAYLKLTFGLLEELHEDTRIRDLTRRYLPPHPDEVLTHQFLALQAATVRYHYGDYDGAEGLVADWRLDRSLEGQLLLARCDWERGYPELARLRLEQQRPRFPGRDELPLQLIRFYRDLGDTTRELNEALVRHLADPASPGPRIDLLHAWQRSGDQARVQRETESYLADNPTDPAALLLLAWFASDTGNTSLVRRLRGLAAGRHYPLETFDLALVQGLALAGDYPAALAAADAALAGPAGANPRFADTLAGLRALACFGAGDPVNGESYLQTFLVRQRPRSSDSILLSRRLAEIGAVRPAQRVIESAVRQHPLDQAALTELVHQQSLARDGPGLESSLPRLLPMRKPSRAVLQEAALRLDAAQPRQHQLLAAIAVALKNSPASPEPEP
ncbi:MAG TPA: tetratricopeptide repeat protein [Lacunisphaera sp.]|nr:tetratricopeptide repeat protein [Lacunisphaera sp.]